MIKIIACIDDKNGIGRDGGLLCRLKTDLKFFKQMTLGHACVFGRTTYEGLPIKPLPMRRSIVLTSDEDYPHETVDTHTSVIAAHTIEEILELSKEEDVWICGGGKVYEAFLPHADEMWITHVNGDFKADTFFPSIDGSIKWDVQYLFDKEANAENEADMIFIKYSKVKGS